MQNKRKLFGSLALAGLLGMGSYALFIGHFLPVNAQDLGSLAEEAKSQSLAQLVQKQPRKLLADHDNEILKFLPEANLLRREPGEKAPKLQVLAEILQKQFHPVKIGEDLYIQNQITGEIRHDDNWVKVGEDFYFVGKDGKIYQNRFVIYGPDSIYYVGPDGKKKVGVQEAFHQIFRLDETGKLIRTPGWLDYQGHRYYMNQTGFPTRSAWATIDQKEYYFNQEGLLQTGMVAVDGTVYRTHPETGARIAERGSYGYEGKIYVSDEKGIPYKDTQVQLGDKIYLLGKDGAALSGEQEWQGTSYLYQADRGLRKDLKPVWPTPSSHRINSVVGYRPEFGAYHNGVDIGASWGSSVHACRGGVVQYAANSHGAHGIMVCILDSRGIYTMYKHLSSFSVQVGQKVKAGQEIAHVGSTGDSTGPHLHLEMRKGDAHGTVLNPLSFSFRELGKTE